MTDVLPGNIVRLGCFWVPSVLDVDATWDCEENQRDTFDD